MGKFIFWFAAVLIWFAGVMAVAAVSVALFPDVGVGGFLVSFLGGLVWGLVAFSIGTVVYNSVFYNI